MQEDKLGGAGGQLRISNGGTGGTAPRTGGRTGRRRDTDTRRSDTQILGAEKAGCAPLCAEALRSCVTSSWVPFIFILLMISNKDEEERYSKIRGGGSTVHSRRRDCENPDCRASRRGTTCRFWFLLRELLRIREHDFEGGRE